MKNFKMWIARHPTQPDMQESTFIEPREEGVYIESGRHGESGEYVDWVECICIPVEGD